MDQGLKAKPHKGHRIGWFNDAGKLTAAGTVIRTEENLCWMNFDDGATNPFIWRFHDGLNKLATELAA